MAIQLALSVGASLPPFRLKGVDDLVHSTEELAQKPILVVIFSCNHCPYAQAWEGRIIALQADYAAQGVQFVMISSNDPIQYPDDDFPAMKARAAEKGYNFPYLFDDTQEVARAYGAMRTPEVFVFDSNRILRYHGRIDDNHERPEDVTRPYLREAIEALLANKVPQIQMTAPAGCTIKWRA
ncbi:MAG: thioredoxin family protein [Anaerolineae bacterium]